MDLAVSLILVAILVVFPVAEKCRFRIFIVGYFLERAESYLIYIDLLREEEAANPLSRMSGRNLIDPFRTILTEP
jgi:hypothetical protein